VSRFRALAPFAILPVLWGFSFPAISVGLRELPPLLFAAFRYDVAAVLLLGAAVATTAWRPTSRGDLEAIVGGGCFLVAGNGFLFVGQQTVPSGVAAIIQGLVPIATALWAMAVLGDRVSPVGWLGVLVGFVGVGLVVRPTPANLLAGDLTGRLLVLVQVASVSLGGVLVERADSSLDAAPRAGWSMLVGAVLLHAGSLAVGEPTTGSYRLVTVAAVLYLGVFATALAFGLFFGLLDRYGAFQASLIGYVVPIVATVVGVTLLDERITPLTLVGFVVVFVGFALLKRASLRRLVDDLTG
jgi:drug/metabolite transporter (DMT)-like permease